MLQFSSCVGVHCCTPLLQSSGKSPYGVPQFWSVLHLGASHAPAFVPGPKIKPASVGAPEQRRQVKTIVEAFSWPNDHLGLGKF